MAVVIKDRPSAPSREFEQLLVDNMDSMFISALRLTQNHADAKDLQQDALVRALRFHHKFEQGTYIKAWLQTILRNTFINNYRKKIRRPSTVELTENEERSSAPLDMDRDMTHFPKMLKSDNILEYLTDDVRLAVDSLPERHRHTLIMADLQDMSYREIADELDCPLGTVMSRLHRSRRLMRSALKDRHWVPAFG